MQTDHSGHDSAQHPTDHDTMDHGSMDHSKMGRGDMGHGDMDHGDMGHGGMDHTGHEIMFRNRFWVCLVLSIPVIIYSPTVQGWFGYTAPAFPGSGLIVPLLSTVIFFYGGLPFLQMAKSELQTGGPAMMSLISLAITVAYVYSMAGLFFRFGDDFFWELVSLVDIMLLGHWIEMRSVRQASGSLDALARLLPDTAEVILPDGKTEEHPVSRLQTDQLVLVRPGAGIPADGVVSDGSSEVDESMVTGESRPVAKEEGSKVVAGTVNSGNGSLRVKITAVGEETALSGIMRLVKEAQQSKSPTQLLADRAASFLFYAAVTVALIAGIAWTIHDGGITPRVISTVVSVLIIACPHALGLAVPLVVANTTGLGAQNGILIRNRQAIETARKLDVIVFDKTGTLTEGKIASLA
ncbi:MAG: HAD-IC family P-type ATPase [Caldilineaceae bacterium]|nr:HAD-IC family P-type ATPase [Caldilineaceae bacterium]